MKRHTEVKQPGSKSRLSDLGRDGAAYCWEPSVALPDDRIEGKLVSLQIRA